MRGEMGRAAAWARVVQNADGIGKGGITTSDTIGDFKTLQEWHSEIIPLMLACKHGQ